VPEIVSGTRWILLFTNVPEAVSVVTAKITYYVRSFVSSRVAVDCWQSFDMPSASAEAKTWPSARPFITLGLVLFVYRAQLSQRVSLAECHVRASYRTAGPCHLLSTPAALTTPRRPQSGCDGLSQFNEDTGCNTDFYVIRTATMYAARNKTGPLLSLLSGDILKCMQWCGQRLLSAKQNVQL